MSIECSIIILSLSPLPLSPFLLIYLSLSLPLSLSFLIHPTPHHHHHHHHRISLLASPLSLCFAYFSRRKDLEFSFFLILVFCSPSYSFSVASVNVAGTNDRAGEKSNIALFVCLQEKVARCWWEELWVPGSSLDPQPARPSLAHFPDWVTSGPTASSSLSRQQAPLAIRCRDLTGWQGHLPALSWDQTPLRRLPTT